MSGREKLREQIRAELDKQFKKDLSTVLQTPEGRRLFSYILMSTGTKESMPTGTYVDHFNSGRRSVGIEMMFACDSIDYPSRMSGMDIRQMAEREYMTYQLALAEDINDKTVRQTKATVQGRARGATEEGKVR